ncbi:MAG: outer membrane beta-barrel protein [Rhizobiales bacterium]|nr:outer membrane beta-barrel protein [Hyphomicrobiales bacterium]
MRSAQVLIVVFLLIGIGGARAADTVSPTNQHDFAASFLLRGGYDTNPEFSSGNGIGGSAFIGAEMALIAGSKFDNATVGVAAEAGTVHYANPEATPTERGKVILRGSLGDDGLKLSSTTTIADVASYNLRSSEVSHALKLETKVDQFKLFVTVEGGQSSLNQTNAIFQDFLPSPHRFMRGAIVPGVSFVHGKAEIGVSVNLSARRYHDEFDDFGYRRDNERMQPFVFVKYDGESVTAFGSVSRLYGKWHDVDFSDVDRLLFDANISWRVKPFKIDFLATRRASETTFPISPITIDTIYSAKASWTIDPKWTLAASLGYADTEYLDSPFVARTLTYGLGVTRDLGNDLTLGLDLTRAQGTLISGARADALIVMSSLTKKFGAPAKATPPLHPLKFATAQ